MARHVSSFFVILILGVIYYLFAEVRPSIEGSDIFRNIDEFNSIGFSEYNYREPIYWLLGKSLIALTSDGWTVIFIMDLFAFSLLYFTNKRNSIYPMMIAIMLSPLFVLGISNIHRQMIAFCFWIFIVSKSSNEIKSYEFGLHMIPFMIHNSLGIVSIAFFMARLFEYREWKLLAAIFLILSTTFLIFGNSLAVFFREGTDTKTGMGLYLVWSSVVAGLCIYLSDRRFFLGAFAVLGVSASVLLFQVSGGSSGSRLFMLIVTALVFWAIDSDRLRLGGVVGTAYQVVLSIVLILPSWNNSFSRDIIVAAYFQVPYGTTNY
jgi:hypothetical protein